ncbi:bacteriocin secretion accessory protein [Streptococcus ruminicola]|uniref:bacteriocin secretion accessory protein n=1 Tax=Streptococcus ruminicola TaxID=2686210 RepID=UPI00241455CB|nr:bacteriocin secretion accessory protein [Streptococcus ruminicola]WFM81878.1 bacteriocin secretion accessory protein [Streptococcus ruminicola]
MNPKLFQSAEFYHRRYHNFATLLVLPMTAFVLFLLLFSLIGKKEITVTSVGSLRPTKIIDVVQSTSNNTVLVNHLSENKTVKKGDLLIQYSDKLEESQIKAIQTQIERDERQQNALNTLKDSLNQNKNLFSGDDEFGCAATIDRFLSQSKTITAQVSQANDSVAKQEAGINRANAAVNKQISELQTQASQYIEVKDAIQNNQTSVSSGNPYTATLNSYLSQLQALPSDAATSSKESLKNQFIADLQGQIDSINSSISSLQTQAASNYSTGSYDTSAASQIESLRQQELTQAETQLAQVTQEKESLQAQLDQTSLSKSDTILKAKENGILHVSDEFEGKTLLPQGSQIAEIYPDIVKTKKVAISYYVDSTHVSQLKKGQQVRLTLEKISNHAIVVSGKISKIASSATQTKNGNFFKVTATAEVTEKDSSKLKYGLQGKTISVIGKKSFFNYYKDRLLKDFQ